MARTGKVDREEILDRRETLRERFNERNAAILDLRSLRHQTNTVYTPKDFEKDVERAGGPVHLPHIMFLMRATQGLLGAHLPMAKRIPEDAKSLADRTVARRIEKWFNLGFYPLVMRRPLYQATDSMAEGGYGVLKVRLHKQAWHEAMAGLSEKEEGAKYNKRVRQIRRDHFPFSCEHVATTSFWPVYEDGELCEVFEVTRRERGPLMAKYGEELKKAGATLDDFQSAAGGDVECVEYWNGDYWALYVGDEKVAYGEHKSRRLRPPYYPMLFSPTGSKDPRYESESIADPLLGLQKRAERWLTLKDYWAEKMSAPGMKMETRDAELVSDLDENTELVWGPNQIMRVPDGRSVDQMVWQGTGQDLNQMWQSMVEWMDDFSLAPVLLGKNTGRISTATQQGQIQLAKGIFGMAMEEIAAGASDICGDVLYLIEKELHADVPIQLRTSGEWLEIGPDDIDGDYHVGNRLKPVIEMENIVNGTFMLAGYDKRMISRARLQSETFHIEDPDEETDARVVEDIVDSPEIAQLIVAKLFKKMMLDREEPVPTPQEIAGMQAPPTPPQMPAPPNGSMPGGPGMPMMPGIQQDIAQDVAPVSVAAGVQPQTVPM